MSQSFVFTPVSSNRKTGPIGVITISRNSCPSACAFYKEGCYAELGFTRFAWDRADSKGLNQDELVTKITNSILALPIIRYAIAGDLIGNGNIIDEEACVKLFSAITKKNKLFTYTHKPLIDNQVTVNGYKVSKEVVASNRKAIQKLNSLKNVTVNLSANSLAHADQLVNLGIGPVVCVIPSSYDKPTAYTPQGNKIIVCPAQRFDKVTCASCQLCTRKNRDCIVGFKAHGSQKTKVDNIINN